MSENKKRIPKRRFKEFENAEAWEQRKFGDIVKRISTSCATDGLPRVEYEDIVSEQGMLNKDIHQKVSNKSGIHFINNDILYGKLRPYLKNWLLAEFEGIAVGDFWVYKSPENDSKFIYSLIQSNLYQTSANMSTGTKMPRADWSVVSNTEFYIPLNIEEQKKIGAFFIDLDNLITLHQRKLDKMKALKKAYLTEMFPAEGERKPKLRFAGFTDDWEQRRLNDVAIFIDGNYGEKYPKDNEFIENGVPFFTSAVIGTSGVFDKKNIKYISKEKNSVLVKAQSLGGDIILTNRGASMGVVAQIPLEYGLVNIGPQLTRIRGIEKADNLFLLSMFKNSSYNQKLLSINSGSAMNFVGLEALGKFEFMCPELYEQAQIGVFFKNIDNLITLHQNKLEKMQNIKKAYLNEMFI